MRRFSFRGMPAGVLVVLCSIVSAAEHPVDAIPDSATVVMRLAAPDQTVESLATLLDQVQPGLGNTTRQQKQALGLLISNPTLAGVDREKDWWGAVFSRPEARPATVLYIPATDIKAMQEALGEEQNFLEYDGYGVYTTDREIVDQLKARIAGKGRSIAEQVAKESKDVFHQGDVSVYVNISQIKQVYAEQIRQLRERSREALKKLGEQETPEVNRQTLQAAAENYQRMLNSLMQLIEDSEGFALSVDFAKDAVVILDYLRVTADTPTARYLAKNPASKFDLLRQLPPDQLAYFGLRLDIATLQSWSTDMMRSMLRDNLEFNEQLQKAMDELKKLDFGEIVYAIDAGDPKSGAVEAVTLTKVTPVEKVREVTRQMARSLGTVKAGNLEQTFELKPEAETYGTHKADVQIVKMKTEDEQQQRMFDLMFGPDGMVTRTVYLDDKVLQTFGGGEAAMKEALQHVEKASAATNGALQRELKNLQTESNVLGLLDLPNIAVAIVGIAGKTGQFPVPIKPDTFQTLDLQPSYLGFAATLESQGVRIKTHIPVEQLRGIARIAATVRMQMMQQRQRNPQ